MTDTKNIRRSICEIGRILFDRELTDSSGGNISIREGDKVYISPRRTGPEAMGVLKDLKIQVGSF